MAKLMHISRQLRYAHTEYGNTDAKKISATYCGYKVEKEF